MSADNWDICPRCVARAQAAADVEIGRVAAMYGVAPADEYETARAALKGVEPEDFRTFREDYEFYGAAQGEVKADYSGACSACGLAVQLKTSKRFWPEGAA